MKLSLSLGVLCALVVTTCHGFQTTTTRTRMCTRPPSFASITRRHRPSFASISTRRHATVAPSDNKDTATTTTTTTLDTHELLQSISDSAQEAKGWSEMFGLDDTEAAFYALFKGIRNTVPLGLKGLPFVLHQADIQQAMDCPSDIFKEWFDIKDLEKAVNDDFLDADRGSTDNARGWQVSSVSEPRGNSFHDAKMLFSEVQEALQQGTVIFNSAGAHICKLAGANLATTDATLLPCAINIYITAPGKKTSAPPHTDKQDVVVVQTCGQKHWRVYSPPDPSVKPMADMVRCVCVCVCV